MSSTRVGAVDCGTNSIRLLVADLPAAGATAPGAPLVDVHREMRVVRLGQGVDATGRIGDEAMARTLAAVRDYAALCRELGVARTRFVATSASRDAENADVFVAGSAVYSADDPDAMVRELRARAEAALR